MIRPLTAEELAARLDAIAETDWPEEVKLDFAAWYVDRAEVCATLKQVGAILGCSHERVRTIERVAVDTLKRAAAGLPRRTLREVVGERNDDLDTRRKIDAGMIDDDVLRIVATWGESVDAGDVAERLGVPESTVYAALHRLRSAGLVALDRGAFGGWYTTRGAA